MLNSSWSCENLGSPADWNPGTCNLCHFFLQCLPAAAQSIVEVELRATATGSWLVPYPNYPVLSRRLLKLVDQVELRNDMFVLHYRRSDNDTYADVELLPVGSMLPVVTVPATVEFGLVRTWLALSEAHNEDRMASDAMPWLRVIDCKTRCLTTLPTGERYVALSYVWGSPSVS